VIANADGAEPDAPNAMIVLERISMYVAEFTLHATPGHYAEVAALYSAFAADFLSDHPALETVMILGDEATDVVRGIACSRIGRPRTVSTATRTSLPSMTQSRRCSRTDRSAWSSIVAPVHGE